MCKWSTNNNFLSWKLQEELSVVYRPPTVNLQIRSFRKYFPSAFYLHNFIQKWYDKEKCCSVELFNWRKSRRLIDWLIDWLLFGLVLYGICQSNVILLKGQLLCSRTSSYDGWNLNIRSSGHTHENILRCTLSYVLGYILRYLTTHIIDWLNFLTKIKISIKYDV